MAKLLLLDRDGTITQNRVRPGDYINDPNEIELIPGVLERLEQYNRDGWMIAVVSNQGGVEKGFISPSDCVEGFRRLLFMTDDFISACYYCPEAWPSEGTKFAKCRYDLHQFEVGLLRRKDADIYYPEGTITQGFRKPHGGMIQAAIADLTRKPTEILMVGDREEDQQAAQNVGVPFQWAEDWRNGK